MSPTEPRACGTHTNASPMASVHCAVRGHENGFRGSSRDRSDDAAVSVVRVGRLSKLQCQLLRSSVGRTILNFERFCATGTFHLTKERRVDCTTDYASSREVGEGKVSKTPRGTTGESAQDRSFFLSFGAYAREMHAGGPPV